MKRKKVIVAGHICLDITPVFPEQRFSAGEVKGVGDILSPGKLIETGAADVHTGGSVANTGLGMKILGADVALMGKVGADAFGEMVCSTLKNYGAEASMLVSGGESTSYSVVLAIPGIDRIFLHNPGANNTFVADDIPGEALEGAALFHFGYPPLMASMYKDNGAELVKVMKRAKEAGAATSLDMAAVDGDSRAGRADWQEILKQVMPYVDFFMPSAEELCFMLDKPRFSAWQRRAAGRDITEILEVDRDIRPLADICISYGAKVLLIKCGAPGIYYRTAGRKTLGKIGAGAGIDAAAWADREGFERGYVPEKILSGAGAGDACIAAFLTAMVQGCAIEECVQLAAAEGASCVTAYDALGGLKPLEELRGKIAAGWEKVFA